MVYSLVWIFYREQCRRGRVQIDRVTDRMRLTDRLGLGWRAPPSRGPKTGRSEAFQSSSAPAWRCGEEGPEGEKKQTRPGCCTLTSVTLGSSGKRARVQTTEANEGQVDMWSNSRAAQAEGRRQVSKQASSRGRPMCKCGLG